jgi:hypothetical protein
MEIGALCPTLTAKSLRESGVTHIELRGFRYAVLSFEFTENAEDRPNRQHFGKTSLKTINHMRINKCNCSGSFSIAKSFLLQFPRYMASPFVGTFC